MSGNGSGSGKGGGSNQVVVQKLDFMFPKVDREFTVQTKGGGVASLVAYGLIAVLLLAELLSWMGQQNALVEHIQVDQSLGKRLQINLNITFPALACEDLHLDAIDVAGDSQIDIEDTLKKRKLHLDGRPLSKEEVEVETNFHRQQQEQKGARGTTTILAARKPRMTWRLTLTTCLQRSPKVDTAWVRSCQSRE